MPVTTTRFNSIATSEFC